MCYITLTVTDAYFVPHPQKTVKLCSLVVLHVFSRPNDLNHLNDIE